MFFSFVVGAICLFPNWDLVTFASKEGVDSLSGGRGFVVYVGIGAAFFFALNFFRFIVHALFNGGISLGSGSGRSHGRSRDAYLTEQFYLRGILRDSKTYTAHSLDLCIGDKVKHRSFGKGKVVALGDDPLLVRLRPEYEVRKGEGVVIEFRKVGRKYWLLADAPIERHK